MDRNEYLGKEPTGWVHKKESWNIIPKPVVRNNGNKKD